QRGRHERALRRPTVLVHIPDEVDRAPLPRACEHPGDRVGQALVRVTHAQADAVEAAALERSEELAPERFGLDLAAPPAHTPPRAWDTTCAPPPPFSLLAPSHKYG